MIDSKLACSLGARHFLHLCSMIRKLTRQNGGNRLDVIAIGRCQLRLPEQAFCRQPVGQGRGDGARAGTIGPESKLRDRCRVERPNWVIVPRNCWAVPGSAPSPSTEVLHRLRSCRVRLCRRRRARPIATSGRDSRSPQSLLRVSFITDARR